GFIETFALEYLYIKFKKLEVDTISHTVKIDGDEIFFPKKEFKLLHFLLSNRGKVLSREVILNHIWGENIYVIDRTIDVHIAKVREKLGEYSDYIETIKGLGYRFNN
ncbi:MAG TPA: winged helix-turn-helix domain-containing protein, partial [Ignavibacteria bacterium]|nr:winged helix-turn-helix domain-containing protein [Ignavibacteria bacterium]